MHADLYPLHVGNCKPKDSRLTADTQQDLQAQDCRTVCVATRLVTRLRQVTADPIPTHEHSSLPPIQNGCTTDFHISGIPPSQVPLLN